MRFRWLAVEWGNRIRHLFSAEDLVWFNAFAAWVAGDGDHPSRVCKRPEWEGFDTHLFHVDMASNCIRAIRDLDDPLSAAVNAAWSFSEYLPRSAKPPTDFNHSHRKRSKNARAEEAKRTREQVLRHATETKEHRERVLWEFCEQFRDVAGNPFRPVTFDPHWRSETAVSLASGIYTERAFDRMPILADALEEAGCDHADVLSHCRGDGPHTRGCWVVDLLLGKA